jgi:hypothetical protein
MGPPAKRSKVPGEFYATDKSQLGPLAKRSRAAEEGWIKRRKGEAAKAGERLKASQLKAEQKAEQKTGGKAPKAGQKAPKAPKAGSKAGQQAVPRGEEKGEESLDKRARREPEESQPEGPEGEKPRRDAKGVFIVKNKGGGKSRTKVPPLEPAVDPKSVNRGKKRSRPVSAEYEEEVAQPSHCNTTNTSVTLYPALCSSMKITPEYCDYVIVVL